MEAVQMNLVEMRHKHLIAAMVNQEEAIEKMFSFDDCVFNGVTAAFRFVVSEATDTSKRFFPLHFYGCVFNATTLDIRVIVPAKMELPEVEIVFKDCLFDKGNFRIVTNLDEDCFDINDKDFGMQRMQLELVEGAARYSEVLKIQRLSHKFNLNNFIKI